MRPEDGRKRAELQPGALSAGAQGWTGKGEVDSESRSAWTSQLDAAVDDFPWASVVGHVPTPTPDDLALLKPFERGCFEVMRWLSRGVPKTLSTLFLHHFAATWIVGWTRRLHVVEGMDENVLDPDERVMMVANHRSFFDQYLLSATFSKRTGYRHKLFFPVRSEFFYDRPLGLLINGVVAGFSMYPPVFRARDKRQFNRYGTREALSLLRTPGTLVGYHPEGTRGKGPDPYALLPAQPGVGELCYKSRPKVLPVFINGLSNDIVGQVRSNFDGTGGPITMVMGPPMDLSEYYAEAAGAETYKRIADHIMATIGKLGERERELRAAALREPRFSKYAERLCQNGDAAP
jgi:1-acyl-sn-glycerol-3-phosphate acyltransferase